LLLLLSSAKHFTFKPRAAPPPNGGCTLYCFCPRARRSLLRHLGRGVTWWLCRWIEVIESKQVEHTLLEKRSLSPVWWLACAGDQVEAGRAHAAWEEDSAVHSPRLPCQPRLLVQGLCTADQASSSSFISPSPLHEAQTRRGYVLLMFYFLIISLVIF